MKKLKSLSLLFPFFNDAGTVKKTIDGAYYHGSRVSSDIEVIALHGGSSQDNTFQEICKQQRTHPHLIIIDKTNNQEGYAVIKHGLLSASKEWIFYTDGDLQYHLDDLEKLVAKQQKTYCDVVCGYKINRCDSLSRRFFGEVYRLITQKCFQLPIRDIDCDFRLIRRRFLNTITLESHNAGILVELIKKLEDKGAHFEEIPIMHHKRLYGVSNYTTIQLICEKLIGDTQVFIQLLKKKIYDKNRK